ncbi:hypothetical protein AGMMS50276_06580 [Synergistales bacterium]|nr:hypothetical protein AGMMS50276_06580 [Synergistales bacterium]
MPDSYSSSVLDSIERVLDDLVRPTLARHGGGVDVVSFGGGVLRVKMRGGCVNCPSAMFDIEQIAADELKEAIPEVKSVVLETGVSDELLDMAKGLMRSRGSA